MSENTVVTNSVLINASPSEVWDALTNPAMLKLWMSDAEIEVISDWKVGSAISILGNANGHYKYKGTILKSEPGKLLRYNSWASISKLADLPENYSIVEFGLTEKGNTTELTLTHSNLIAEAAVEHSRFYWRSALNMIKNILEKKLKTNT